MPRSAKKQVNREKLLDQGVIMLMDQGYHGTGLQEILDAVQVPKGSFYNYFDSKEAYGAEVIQRYIEPFLNQLTACLNHPDYDSLGALKAYFNELIDELEQQQFKGGCLLGNLMGEMGDTSEVCRRSLRRALTDYRDLLATGLERGQQEGTVRSDLDARRMADLLVDVWQGALLRMKIEKSVQPLVDCCQSLLGDYFAA